MGNFTQPPLDKSEDISWDNIECPDREKCVIRNDNTCDGCKRNRNAPMELVPPSADRFNSRCTAETFRENVVKKFPITLKARYGE